MNQQPPHLQRLAQLADDAGWAAVHSSAHLPTLSLLVEGLIFEVDSDLRLCVKGWHGPEGRHALGLHLPTLCAWIEAVLDEVAAAASARAGEVSEPDPRLYQGGLHEGLLTRQHEEAGRRRG